MSSIVASRAFTLTAVIPSMWTDFPMPNVGSLCCLAIIKLYHRFSSTNTSDNLDSSDNTPLLVSEDEERPPEARPKKHRHPHHTPTFDLIIAQLSLLLEVICYGIFPFFASASPAVFKPIYIILSDLSACGAGFGPAIQSLANELYTRRGGTESGKLFGTLSVIQTVW